jgi:hypothetical protein
MELIASDLAKEYRWKSGSCQGNSMYDIRKAFLLYRELYLIDLIHWLVVWPVGSSCRIFDRRLTNSTQTKLGVSRPLHSQPHPESN